MPGTTRYSATFDRTYEEEDRVDPSPPPTARRSRSQSWQANSGLDGGRPYTPLGIRPPAQRSSSTDNGPKGPEHIPTRTVAKTAVKAHSNPFQFVKVGTCPLYRKAEEQLKKAKDVKKPDVLKEEEEEWQSNLDSWKSRRRKMSEDVFRRQEEIKQFEQEEQIAQVSQKKTKTFSEMVESRAHRGRALSLCLISSPMELQNWEFESSSLKNGSCSTFSGESEENSTVNSEDEGVSLKGILDKTSQNDTLNNHHRTNGDSHIEKNGSKLEAHNGDYDKLSDLTTNNLQMKPKEGSYIDSGLESISSNRAGDTPDSGSDFSQDSGSSIDCESPRTGVNVLEEFSSKSLQVSPGYEIIVKLCLSEKSQDFGFTYLGGKDEGQVIIASVLEGSKADSSALHLGDQILTIDGKDVSSKKHIEIAAMMQKARERGEISLLLWRHTKAADNGVTNGFNHSEKQCSSTFKLNKSENHISKTKSQQYEKSIESENEMYVDDFEELQRQSELMAPNSKSETNVQANRNASLTSVPSIKDKIPKSFLQISSKAKVNVTNGSVEEPPKNEQSMNLDVNNENQTKNGVKGNRIRKKGVYALNVSAASNQNATERTSVNSLFPLSPVTELPSPADDTKTLSSSLSSDTNTSVLDSKKETFNEDAPSSKSKENDKLTSTATVAASNVSAIPAIELKDNSLKKDDTKNDPIVPSSPTITKNKEKNTSLGSPQEEKPKLVLKKVKKVKKESDKPVTAVTESVTSKILASDDLKTSSPKEDKDVSDIAPSSSIVESNENTSVGSPQEEKPKPNIILRKVKKVKKASVTENVPSSPHIKEVVASSNCITSDLSAQRENPTKGPKCISANEEKKITTTNEIKNKESFQRDNKVLSAGTTAISPVTQITVPKNKMAITTADTRIQSTKHANSELANTTSPSTATNLSKSQVAEEENTKQNTSHLKTIPRPKENGNISLATKSISVDNSGKSEIQNASATTVPSCNDTNISSKSTDDRNESVIASSVVTSKDEHIKSENSQGLKRSNSKKNKNRSRKKNANGQKVNTSPAKQIEEYKNQIGDSLNVVFQSEPKNTNPENQSNNVKSSQISSSKAAPTAELVPDILPVEKVAEEMEKLILEQLEEEERAKELSSGVQLKNSVFSPEHLLTAPPKLAEPPKEKPPPPPSASEGSQKDVSLTRINSTKRIKKEIYKRRSNFLGIDNAEESLACNEPSIPPPPALEEILKAEMELDRQSRLKIESASTERLNLEENEILQKEREIIESLESEERQKQLLNGTEDLKSIPNNLRDVALEEDRIELLKNERKRLDAEKLLNEEQQQLQLMEEKQLREREEFIRKQEADKSAVLSDPSLSIAANVSNLSQPSISSSLSVDAQSSVSLSGACGDGKTLTSNSSPELSEAKSSECDEKKIAQKPAVPPKPLKKKEAIRKERERLRQEQEALQREREEHRQKLLQEQEELIKHQKSHAPDVPVSRLGPLPPLVPPGFSPPLTSTSMNATPNAREIASFPSRSHHGASNGAAGSINAVELMSPPVVRQNRVPPPRKAVQNEAWGQQKANENIPFSVLPKDEIPVKAASHISSDLKSNESISSNINEKHIKNEQNVNVMINSENQRKSETKVKKIISKSGSLNKTVSSASCELNSDVKIVNINEKYTKKEQSVNAEMGTEKNETKVKQIISKRENLNKTDLNTSCESNLHIKIVNANEKQVQNEQSVHAEIETENQKKSGAKVKKMTCKSESPNTTVSSTSCESKSNIKICNANEKQIKNEQIFAKIDTENQKKGKTSVKKNIIKSETLNKTAIHIPPDLKSNVSISSDIIERQAKNEQSVNAEMNSENQKKNETKVKEIISRSPNKTASNTSCESNLTLNIANINKNLITNDQNVNSEVDNENKQKSENHMKKNIITGESPNETDFNASCELKSSPNISNVCEKQNKNEQSIGVEMASENQQKNEAKVNKFVTKSVSVNKNAYNTSSESYSIAKFVNAIEKQITNEQSMNPCMSSNNQQKSKIKVKTIATKSISNKTVSNTSPESDSNLNFSNVNEKQVLNKQSLNTDMSTETQKKSKVQKIITESEIPNKTAANTSCESNSNQNIANINEIQVEDTLTINVEMGSENQQKYETKVKKNSLNSENPIKRTSTSSLLNPDEKIVNANDKQIKNEQSVNTVMGSENQQNCKTKVKKIITKSKSLNKNISNTCESNSHAQIINADEKRIKNELSVNAEKNSENQLKSENKIITKSDSLNKTASNTSSESSSNATIVHDIEKQIKNDQGVNVQMNNENQHKGETKVKEIPRSESPNKTTSNISCESNSISNIVNANEKQNKNEQIVNANLGSENQQKSETKVKKISIKSVSPNATTSDASYVSNSNAKIVNANEKQIKNELKVNAENSRENPQKSETKVKKIITSSEGLNKTASNTSFQSSSNTICINAIEKQIKNEQSVSAEMNSENRQKSETKMEKITRSKSPNKMTPNMLCESNSNSNVNAIERQNKNDQIINAKMGSENQQKNETKVKKNIVKSVNSTATASNASCVSNTNTKLVNAIEKQIKNELSVNAEKNAEKQIKNELSVNAEKDTEKQKNKTKVKKIITKNKDLNNTVSNTSSGSSSNETIANVIEKQNKNEQTVDAEIITENQQKLETKVKKIITKRKNLDKNTSNTSCELNSNAKIVNDNDKQSKNKQIVNASMVSKNQQGGETMMKKIIIKSVSPNASDTSCASNSNAEIINAIEQQIKNELSVKAVKCNENQQKSDTKIKKIITNSESCNKTLSRSSSNKTIANAIEKQNKTEQTVNAEIITENQQKLETKVKKIITKRKSLDKNASNTSCESNSNAEIVNAIEQQIKNGLSVKAEKCNENQQKSETKLRKVITKSESCNKTVSNTLSRSSSNETIVSAIEKQNKNEQTVNTAIITESQQKLETKVKKIITKRKSLDKNASNISCELNSNAKIVNDNDEQIVNASMVSENQQRSETKVKKIIIKSVSSNASDTSCVSNSNTEIVNAIEQQNKNVLSVKAEKCNENQQKSETKLKKIITKSESSNKTVSNTSSESSSNATIANAIEKEIKNEQRMNTEISSENQQKSETKVKKIVAENKCLNKTASNTSSESSPNTVIINAIEKEIKNEQSVNIDISGVNQKKGETKVKKIITKNKSLNKNASNTSCKSNSNEKIIDANDKQIINEISVDVDVGGENQKRKSENLNKSAFNTSYECNSNAKNVNANEKLIKNEQMVNTEMGNEMQQNSEVKVKKKIIKKKILNKSVASNTLGESNSNIADANEKQIKNEHSVNPEMNNDKQQENKSKVKKNIINIENPNKTDSNTLCESNSNPNIANSNEILIQNGHSVNAEVEGESQQKNETKVKKKITKKKTLIKTVSNTSCESNSNPDIASDANMRQITNEPSVNAEEDSGNKKKSEAKVKKKVIKKKVPSVRKQNQDSLTESRYNQNHWLIQEAEMRRISELQERQLAGQLPCSQTHLAEDDVCSPPRVPVIPPTHNQHLNFAVQDKMWNYAQTNMPLKKYPPPVIKESLHTIYPRETAALQPPTKPSRVVPMERQEQMLSVSGRKRCSHCNEELGRGAAMIIESLQLYYHIHCFQCCVCQAQLGNGSCGTDVRVRNNKLHCHNCYSNDEAGLKFSQV